MLPTRTCEICGNEFTPKDRRGKYCSVQCARKHAGQKRTERNRAKRIAEGREGKRKSVLRIVGNCVICGKAIEGNRSTRRYCDKPGCRRVALTMKRLNMTVEEAKAKCAELDRRREERAEEAAEPDVSGWIARCIYYGKCVPREPQTAQMSSVCRNDGMINVCMLKGRCPYGRSW